MEEAPAIGIDLGTTNSCVAVFRHGKVEIIPNDLGNRTTPSCIAFTENGRLFGDPAKDQGMKNIDNTIFNVKRLIGHKFNEDAVQDDMKYWSFQVINDKTEPKIPVEIDGEIKTFFPEEISSMVLRKMKETAEAYLGKTVKKAVITVPACFTGSQRQSTVDAATIAGLEVLRIINEPTAAAIAYGLEKDNSNESNALIFNLGGGNFDVSIVNIKNGVFEVISTAGDAHLGGEDFDNRMVNYFVKEFERQHGRDISQSKKALHRLKTACEQAKKILSFSTLASIEIDSLYGGIDFYTSISRARFEEINADLFRRVMKLVKKAIRDAKMYKVIDDIVLVGGSSRIPEIQKLLQDFFDGKELSHSVNPDEAVAYGAAVQAAISNDDKSKEINNLVFLDVTPHSLGVHTTGGLMSVVIERNTTIPTKITETFTLLENNQSVVKIEVFEGEYELAKFNTSLGKIVLDGVPPAPAGETKVDVTFSIDANGILTVHATEKITGIKNEITFSYNRAHLGKDKIERMIKEEEEYKVREEKRRIMLVAKNSLESYCVSMKNTIGEMISKKCDETIRWLSSDEAAEKDYEIKQKELEIIFSLIMKLVEIPKL